MRCLLTTLTATVLVLALLAPATAAQVSTPEPTLGRTLPAVLENTERTAVGVALLAETGEAISVQVLAVGLAPGLHGLHLHETGVCDPDSEQAFASVGGHLNPSGAEHGEHAGDLGNISATADGTAMLQGTTEQFTLEQLTDADGAAIVITVAEDELEPAGDSYGEAIACGVLAEPADEMADGPAGAAAQAPTATDQPAGEAAQAAAVTDEPASGGSGQAASDSTAMGGSAGGSDGAPVDTDGDGLADSEEADRGTNPLVADSDGDELDDGEEVNVHGTEPLDFDTDEDGLRDGFEVNGGTDPFQADPDEDGLWDELELLFGTDPFGADSDGDALLDGAEFYTHGTDPLVADSDNDSLTDGAEVNDHGTDPLVTDTDGDGLGDGFEANIFGSDPLNPDTEGDGLTDDAEADLGTNPLAADTDGDGVSDGDEVSAGTNPLNPLDS